MAGNTIQSTESVFSSRHIGISSSEKTEMLKALGCKSMEDLISQSIPSHLMTKHKFCINSFETEKSYLKQMHSVASKNVVAKNFIGQGFYGCTTPSVIKRTILENPNWYTAYTPYQAEISQGRMESLINFQTMICDLTGLPIANASLLDDATAAAEAMAMAIAAHPKLAKNPPVKFFVSRHCFDHIIEVMKTRAACRDIELIIEDESTYDFNANEFAGALFQYPNAEGIVSIQEKTISDLKAKGTSVIFACDILSLCLFKEPAAFGADIVIGSTQRLGVPMMYGGPHAAYLATTEDYKRLVPGRYIGVSKDRHGKTAYRMTLQTREQHIRREKATSNICTSQVLLANMAAMYAVYHGPQGLKAIAEKIRGITLAFKDQLQAMGMETSQGELFDTVSFKTDQAAKIHEQLKAQGINVFLPRNASSAKSDCIRISFDETHDWQDAEELLSALNTAIGKTTSKKTKSAASAPAPAPINKKLARTSAFLSHEVFNRFHTETKLMRYISKLERKDLTLTKSMIPLGSCTMKLNSAIELAAVSVAEFANLHPFAPADQAMGYKEIIDDLSRDLGELTGLPAVSLQPNAGSQGEYCGLLMIKKYHEKNGDQDRNICLIPVSAHGTNPASAVMAGLKVVTVKCDSQGNINPQDLKEKITKHQDKLFGMMITYPSTHGVFESQIKEVCEMIHNGGGLVYLDGANFNAMVGICRPGEFGADVCHLNLHKTFAIPHGGGGPGVGPVCGSEKLREFLPTHNVLITEKDSDPLKLGATTSSPYGSAGILPISWAYIKLLGTEGLKQSTEAAILSANYMASKIEKFFPVVYKSETGRVAHEFILDLRPLKKELGIESDDIAKRLMDYGFHAPTMSWPVAGTLMVEPTESESLDELERFIESMASIREEIDNLRANKYPKDNNPLVNAPHSLYTITSDSWDYPYSRQQAAYPLNWVRDGKYWPATDRIDSAFGDRNFMCTCPPLSDYE